MLYDSAKINGRPFSKDVAFASLASLVVHLAVAMIWCFGLTQTLPLELPQVMTVSLVSSFASHQGAKPVSAVEAGAQVSPGRKADDEREGETPIPVAAARAGKELPEKSNLPPAAPISEAGPAAFVPPLSDDNLPDLSLAQTGYFPPGRKSGTGLSAQTGEGQANPPVKGATSSSAGEVATGGVSSSGYAKVEAAEVGFTFATPRYGQNEPPVYPLSARLRGYVGVVMLSVEVLADGTVGRLEIKKTSGYNLLDQSALASVKKWKFSPGRKMGAAVKMWVDVPVRFALK